MTVKAAAELFRAFGDPTRLRILHLLHAAGELCAGDLGTVLGLPQSTVSRHLARLRRARMVDVTQVGLWVYYRLAEPTTCLRQVLVDCFGRCLREAEELAADARRLEATRAAGGCCEPPPAEAVAVSGLVRRRRLS